MSGLHEYLRRMPEHRFETSRKAIGRMADKEIIIMGGRSNFLIAYIGLYVAAKAMQLQDLFCQAPITVEDVRRLGPRSFVNSPFPSLIHLVILEGEVRETIDYCVANAIQSGYLELAGEDLRVTARGASALEPVIRYEALKS